MPFYSAQERSDFRWSLPATKIQGMNGSALPDYNTIMRKRRIGWLPLAALILAIGISLIYYWSIPQVLEVTPSQNATAVQAGASIRVRFSRPMQHGGVESRLVTDPPRRGNFSWEENTLTFTPDQPWGSGETVQVRLEPGARSTGLLSMALRQGLSWTFTVRQPLLAYLYPSDASADIYLLDPSNGEITRLTDAPGTIMDYSVSLDGSVIYFNTEQGDGGSSIYGLNRNSGESRLLLECPGALCRYPQISPGGDFLAYERTDLSSPVRLNLPQVWLLPLSQDTSDGAPLPIGEPRLVAPPAHRTQQPQWNSTGLLSFYDYQRSAFIVQEPQGREIAQFPSQTGIPGAWHPDAEHYVFPEIYTNEISNPNTLPNLEAIQNSHLLQFSLDGSQKDLTGSDDVEDTSPAFSPDGKTLAFGRKFLDLVRWTPGRQLWLMGADGSQGRAVTNDPDYNHYDMTWSPDGVHLAYVRFNKNSLIDPPELWLMNADGSGATRLISGGYSPQWLP